MMKYPRLNEIPTSRDILDKFKGYNHNLRIGDGEFYDMKNLTGDDYPVLSPRKKRGTFLTPNNPNGMCSNTRFCYIDGSDLVLRDENGSEETYDLALTKEPKDLISIGANIVIMPDQKYINTVSPEDRGSLLKGIYSVPLAIGGSSAKPKLVCTFVDSQGKTYIDKANNKGILVWNKTTTGYPSAKEYQGWLMWSKHTNKRFQTYRSELLSDNTWAWKTYSGAYNIAVFGVDDDSAYFETQVLQALSETPLTIQGINDQVSKIEWDSVTGYNDYTSIVFSNTIEDRATTDETVMRTGFILRYDAPLSGSQWSEQRDPSQWLPNVLEGEAPPIVIDTPIQIKTSKSSESTIPDMDYVIESNNRLWGCKYGNNNSGDFVNEIYASVWGDFKNWYKRDGISTDAWATSLGTSGKFTGAVNFGGYPIFFKEDCMHRIYGDYVPYSAQMIPCKGVQDGCHKSLAIVNDVLYYKSRTGICAYDGSLPVEISTNFGDKQYYNAVGGAIGNKYYVSMQDEEGKWHMFVYDTIKRMWHREDETQATQFCNHRGELYYIDHSDHFIHTVKGTGVQETNPIPWSAETGILGATTPDNKYVTRIDVRMTVAKGSKLSLHIEYDSMGDWERLMEIEGLTLNTFTIPVIPRRCDHFRLKLEGEGEAKIFSISKTLEDAE